MGEGLGEDYRNNVKCGKTRKERMKKQSQSSSQQTKPSYCMCMLPLPSVWLIAKCPNGKEQKTKKKQTKWGKKSTKQKIVCDLKEDNRGRKMSPNEKMRSIWVENLPVISTKEHELLGHSEFENGH